MGGLAQLIGSLLSWLHQFPVNICPGAWPWTISMLGAVIAAFPAASAVIVALVRKATGNDHSAPVLVTFGIVGVASGFLAPWLISTYAADLVHNAVAVGAAPGLTGNDVAAFGGRACFFAQLGNQGNYLGNGANAYEALMRSNGGTFMFAVHLVTLVGLPVLALLTVLLQQRFAQKRGPGWPGRFAWLPFVVFVVATAGIQANFLAQLWLGFLPASLAGAIAVRLLGSPSWAVINRPRNEPPPQSPPYSPPPEPRQPPPEPRRPPQELPHTLVAGPPPSPANRLADTPGPLPFAIRDATTVLWNSAGGRFQRVRQLGHGGFGTVWLARDTQLDRTVALKFAHAPDPETQQRMLREARALAAVHHPNCVRVYDIIEDVDGLGIVMEYIDGQPLSDAVGANGPLDDLAAARLWSTMAGAMAAAHAQGVLHRDVKPANILVDGEGAAHLIDFGIARTKGDVTLTAVGMMLGTPDFLAPETAATGIATPASDAWQVAATVSYALTGQPPRGHRANPMSALMAAAQRLPTTHLPDRSRHRALLQAALDADPSRRPTLNTVHRELAGWLARGGYAEDGPVTVVAVRTEAGTRPLR